MSKNPMIWITHWYSTRSATCATKNTGTKEFKELVSEIAMLLCYEATRDLPTEEVEVETPIAVAKTRMLAGRKLALVPILRAGLGMVDGMLTPASRRQGGPHRPLPGRNHS